METLRQTIKTLFLLQKSESVATEFFSENSRTHLDEKVDKNWFVRAYLDDVSPIRTKDQVESIYEMLRTKWMCSDKELSSFRFSPDSTIFNSLLHFTVPILRENAHEPVCRYDDLLRWHELASLLGEDLLTTPYLAAKDLKMGMERRFFNWKDIISHDNAALNNIFGKRMKDLHYHLYGSIFVFDLNWLSLMNDVNDRKQSFLKTHDYLSEVHLLHLGEKVCSLYNRVMKAAAIRLLLFWYVDGGMAKEDYQKLYEIVLRMWSMDEDLLIDTLRQDISHQISVAREIRGHVFSDAKQRQAVLDYAISSDIMVNTPKSQEYLYSVLSGERYLMYRMFRKIYSGECDATIMSLFYAYLLIKGEFRSEIVQLNDSVGFANFYDYQDRKFQFLKANSVYEELAAQVAIGSSLSDKCKSLEARITPGKTRQDLEKRLLRIESSVKDGLLTYGNEERLGDRYSIILHFIKRRDDKLERNASEKNMYCRYYKLRKNIKKEAIALKDWLRVCAEQDHEARVIGVDAASSEIACRPEVFGQAYRYLKNLRPTSHYSKQIKALGFTFHVGEDFLDIVDGLRAIREALVFLNLENRDRIGHALVLGTDVERYYAKRGHYVSMTKQMLLDNIVWMYFEGSTCVGFNKIAVKLKALYEKYYREIYEKSMKRILQSEDFYSVNIEDYYQSWLLRGDQPEKYMTFSSFDDNTLDGYYELYSYNENKSVCKARDNIKARYLYYLYHYDNEVYDEGNKSDQIKLSQDDIVIVKQLQAKLLSEIERLHISIETNPTSNYRIGDFDRYDEHPILQFFNYGLKHEGTAEHSVTVSINTDDKGVFSTSLEREFSVMAAALEKKCDIGNGGNSPRMIYDWLDRIREMAFEMEF